MGNQAMHRGALSDLTTFITVADSLSFRGAGERLGVTPSALSHSMKQLEERLGTRLLNRTTQRFSTDAGRAAGASAARIRPDHQRHEDLNEARGRPVGNLRHVSGTAAATSSRRSGNAFDLPGGQPEVEVGGRRSTSGKVIDAGTDPGTTPSMIAVRVTDPKDRGGGDAVYFAQHGTPQTPDDLLHHGCIQYRVATAGSSNGCSSAMASTTLASMAGIVNWRARLRGSRRIGAGGRHQRGGFAFTGPTGPRAGGMVACDRGTLSLPSKSPADARRAACADRDAAGGEENPSLTLRGTRSPGVPSDKSTNTFVRRFGTCRPWLLTHVCEQPDPAIGEHLLLADDDRHALRHPFVAEARSLRCRPGRHQLGAVVDLEPTDFLRVPEPFTVHDAHSPEQMSVETRAWSVCLRLAEFHWRNLRFQHEAQTIGSAEFWCAELSSGRC